VLGDLRLGHCRVVPQPIGNCDGPDYPKEVGCPSVCSGRVSEHPNAETLRAFYSCFDGEDWVSQVKAFLTPAVVWHVTGDNSLAGNFSGPDAVTEQMLRYQDRSHGTLRLNTSIMATVTHAVAIHVATASVPGFAYSAHEVDVFHIQNGMITEFWSFSEDQAGTDRLWS